MHRYIYYSFSAFSYQSFSSAKEEQIINLIPPGQNFIAFTHHFAHRALLSSYTVPCSEATACASLQPSDVRGKCSEV